MLSRHGKQGEVWEVRSSSASTFVMLIIITSMTEFGQLRAGRAASAPASP